MHKSATKCNETIGKWCKNKHGTSKIIDTLETYQARMLREAYSITKISLILCISITLLGSTKLDLNLFPRYIYFVWRCCAYKKTPTTHHPDAPSILCSNKPMLHEPAKRQHPFGRNIKHYKWSSTKPYAQRDSKTILSLQMKHRMLK
jgi:hypothetical protein